MRLAGTFGFGYFTTFGVLAMANVFVSWPSSLGVGAAIALIGGVGALLVPREGAPPPAGRG